MMKKQPIQKVPKEVMQKWKDIENDLIDYDVLDLQKIKGKEHLKLNEPTIKRALFINKVWKPRFFDFSDFFIFWLSISGFMDKPRTDEDIKIALTIVNTVNPKGIEE